MSLFKKTKKKEIFGQRASRGDANREFLSGDFVVKPKTPQQNSPQQENNTHQTPTTLIRKR